MPVLKRYNSTTQEWEVIGGGAGGGGGASTLSDLTDTNISTPTNGQVLTYDNNTSKWVNSNNVDISGKADKVSGATNGDIAKLDANGNLVDSGISATSVSTAVTNSHTHSNKTYLDKIPTSTGSNGQVLTSSGSAWSWANVPTELPSVTGNANKILSVNSGATGVEWITSPGGAWGSITGTLSNQTDLQNALNNKEKTITKQTSAPANPSNGDLWIDTDEEVAQLPVPTSADENKVLSVDSNGMYILRTINAAENMNF